MTPEQSVALVGGAVNLVVVMVSVHILSTSSPSDRFTTSVIPLTVMLDELLKWSTALQSLRAPQPAKLESAA